MINCKEGTHVARICNFSALTFPLFTFSSKVLLSWTYDVAKSNILIVFDCGLSSLTYVIVDGPIMMVYCLLEIPIPQAIV